MKKFFFAAIALLLALVFLLPACFNVKIELPPVGQQTTAPTSAEVPSAMPNTEAAAPTAPIATVPVTEATTLPPAPTVPATTVPDDHERPTEPKKTPDQMDPAQLLAFFNYALNGVKTNKVGFKKHKLTSILDLQLSNSAANALVGLVKSSLLTENGEDTLVQKGEDSVNVFSPSGKTYASDLRSEDLTAISCAKDGDNYVVSVAVKGETNPTYDGSVMSRAFDFMTVDDVVNIYAPKVGATVERDKIEVVFSDCTAKLTVRADGTVVGYETYVKGVMHMNDASIKKVITINTDLAVTLASTTTYSDFQY